MPKHEVFVTTSDNPYDYFTQFEDWFAFDEQKGYCTCEFVARLANTSDVLTDEENDEEIEKVVDEICKYNILGLYKKVTNKN